MTPADQRVRDRIRRDLDTTLIIEAAAGTGKTTELVNRIIAVIASGRARLREIVAVTFTEKAAGELKLRLREEIDRAFREAAGFSPAEQEHLRLALEDLEEARIGTIHSFCADLLRERPVEARVDPAFEVAPEDVATNLFESAFERWFEEALKAPGPGMRRLLRRRDAIVGEGPRPIARAAANSLREWRDFDAAWERVPFDRDREIDHIVDDIEKLARIAADGHPDDWLRRSLEEISRPVAEATRLETSRRDRDYDALEHVLSGVVRNQNKFNWGKRGEMFGERPRPEVLALRDALHTRLLEFRVACGKDLAPLLREEMRPVIAYYEALKHRAGVLDFLDLLLVARDLVRDNADVRVDLQRRFTHIFIDEFQDTDPLQAEILLLLSADDPAEANWENVRPTPGKLFIVGDPKQSIYRFRRADVALYQGLKTRLTARGAALEHLTVSFRATAELQDMVNAAIAPLMPSESETQPAYVPLQKFRAGVDSQPAVVALPVPAPYSDDGRFIRQWKIDDSLPDATGAYVDWLIHHSGWTVTEREAPEKRVPIEPRHVCILFRRLNSFGTDVTRPYIRALEARHIPHVLVKGGSFNEREEVEAIRNLLGAIERPDDELVVFAALRGPVLALSDAALLEYRENQGSLHPFRKLKDGASPVTDEVAQVAHALELLRDLHRGRNRRPIADTIGRVLTETRAHAGFAIWPTGEQALANVMRLMDMARRYEARGGATSFRGFVDELEERAERDEASEVPVVEDGTEGVRIMTVHRAKGLEFPVVILADLTCKETRDPSRHVNPTKKLCAQRIAGYAPVELLDNSADEERRDREEAIRVLYVAATRARDLLVVPAVGDEEREGWLQGLSPAIYPDPKKRRGPITRTPTGVPEFGDDSVKVRVNGFRAIGKEHSVMPGQHLSRVGTHRVVWWDPSKLELDVSDTMGLRQIRLLEADEKKVVSTRSIERWTNWRDARAKLLATGAAETTRVKTATELAVEKPSVTAAIEVEVIETARDGARPHGPRFGSLVHLAMLRVAFDATDDAVLASVAASARMLGADDAEVAAAARAVSTALKSPLMMRVRNSLDIRRECPVLLKLDDGAIVEGIADLAFAEGANGQTVWNIVDFKTDVEIAGRLAEYRAQISLYARGIARASNASTHGILFWI
ncbi:MAG TPA: UvrD-helicase domain-containing protein [Candidatus Binataceae bacterium]|nr:UvrD-helicase domain-containing protein [Candidatus Binataceae bacterium]